MLGLAFAVGELQMKIPFNRHSLISLAAIASCLAILPSKSALAQDSSIIAVVHASDPAAQKPAAYAKYYIRNYFQADSRYDSVEIDKKIDALSQQTAAKQLQLAAEMVQKGREAYDSLELDQAIDFLQNAISKYERNVSYLDSTRPLSDAYIALGASYILRGEEKTGKRALVSAIHIDPLAQPDPRIFNPSMMEIFNDARDEAQNSPRGAVNVISNPGYAEVHLNGKFIGVTPLSKGDIPSGRQIFQLRQDGYRTYGRVVDLAPHTEESISGSLEATAEAARLRDMYSRAIKQINKETMADSIRELASYFQVNNIFVAEVALEGEMVVLTGAQYSVATGQRVKIAKTTFLFDAEQFEYSVQKYMNANFSAENLNKPSIEDQGDKCVSGQCADGRLCTADSDCAGRVSSTKPKKTGSPMPTMKKVLGFGLLGGGAGVMLIGGGLWIGAGSKAYIIKDPKQKPLYSQRQIKDFQSSGKAMAVAGDVLFSIGAVAAVAGGALLLFWNPKPKTSTAVGGTETASAVTISGSLAPVQGGAYLSMQGTF